MDKQTLPRPGAMALAVALALGLSGCGGGGSNVRPPSAPPAVPGSSDPGSSGSDADVTFDSSASATWSNGISGTGGLIKDGTGKLVLAGTNTYTGGTTINKGTLQIGNGGVVGSIRGDVRDNGSLVFDRRDDVTFDGIISGTGSLEQSGTGRLILTGNNTYAGGTSVSHGTLQLGTGGTTGSIVGNVMDNGSLVFDQGGDVSFSGIISGTGSLEQSGAGRLTLTGNNTYSGGTSIHHGTLQLGSGGTTGWIVGNVMDNGSLVFDRGGDVSFAGIISGTGSLEQSGTGRLILTGNNTYTGGTSIHRGTLQLGNGSTTGSVVGNVTNNGSLVFDRSDHFSFDGVVSGGGSLVKLGDGTLTLTGANTYTGGTWIKAGTMQVGNGGSSGSITGNTVDDGALLFNRSGEIIYSGSISGSGSLQQNGNGGTLTLDGDSGAFMGTTSVDAGTLIVGSRADTGAKLGGAVVVEGIGAVLGGYGGVGTAIVAPYGVLAPGSSTRLGTPGAFGTLTVNGDLTLQQGSYLDINLGSSGATLAEFGSADNVQVNGNVVLNGATLNVDSLGDMGPGLYNIITYTGTLSQSYGGLLIAPVPPKQQFTLQYVDGQVNLLAEPNPAIALWAPGGPLGGSGTWTPTSATWTDIDGSAPLGPMAVQPGFAEFQGTSGIVAVDDSAGAVSVIGMQFFVDGYVLAGNSASSEVNLVKNSTGYAPVIEVGDGTAASASDAATISAVLAGTDGLITTGYGRLVLTGANVLSGKLQINGGTTEFASGSAANVHEVAVDNGGGMNSTMQVDSGFVIDASVNLSWGAVLKNQGTINNAPSGGQPVDGLAGYASVVNENGGEITSTHYSAVEFHGGGSLTNRGSGTTISLSDGSPAGGYAVVFYNEPGTVENSNGATIQGPDGGLTMHGGGEVVNSGSGSSIFTTSGSYGVTIDGGPGTVTNSAGASISGPFSGVAMKNGGQVINDGIGSVIAADVYPGGEGWGIRFAGADSTVVNTNGAVIRGTLGGIVLANGGKVVNGAGSTIESLNPGDNDCGDVENCAIYVDARNDTFGGPLTMTNAGRVVGNVQMDPGAANIVTLTAGGSIAGDLKIGTNAASTLTLNGNSGSSQLYSEAVSGATTFNGILIKDGEGEWTIDNSGLSSVTQTAIQGGTLKATGTLAGQVDVNAAGRLEGVPGVAGLLSNAGTVAILGGDTKVGGKYTQASTGTLAVSLGSKLDVAGTATLNGGTLEITGADSGYVSNTHTDVLTATGGVHGTFDRLVKDSGVVFTATTINYGANSVWLDTIGLDVTTAASGAGVSYTPASMGSAVRVQGTFEQLDAMATSGTLSAVSDDFLQSAGQFQQAPTLWAAQASLRSLSGELHAVSAAMTFEAVDASSRALSDRFDNLLDRGSDVGAWTQSLSLGGGMAQAGFDGVDFQLNGWMVGNDRKIGSSGVAGFAFGQSRGQQRLNRSFDHDSSRNTEAMLYTGWISDKWYTLSRAGFGHFQQDVSRQILLGYDTQGVETRYGGRYSTASGEGGMHFHRADSYLAPFVDLQYVRIDRSAFAEQGAGGFGLRSNAQTLDRWQAGFGVRARHHWNLSRDRSVDLHARAQWQRTLLSHGDVFDATFVGFEEWQPLVGIGLSRYSGLFGVGLDATLSSHTALKFSYDYDTGQRDNAQSLSASLNVAF